MTSLNPFLRIGRQLTEVLVAHEGASETAARKRAVDMLERVRIPDAARRIDQYPHEFSGGMRQRVMLAMALVVQARSHHRRRADHGPRRDRAGADPRSAPRHQTRSRHLNRAHQPRFRRHRAGCRSRHGHVCRPPRRAGLRLRSVRRAAASLYAWPSRLHAARRRPCWSGAASPFPASRPICSASAAAASSRRAARWSSRAAAPPCRRCTPPAPTAPAPASSWRPYEPRILDVRDLTVRFPVRGRGLLARTRDLVAVDAVSFDMQAGETLGIVGESGCGKSTLGRAVLGLIPAQEGRVAWMGRDLRALDAASNASLAARPADRLPGPARFARSAHDGGRYRGRAARQFRAAATQGGARGTGARHAGEGRAVAANDQPLSA